MMQDVIRQVSKLQKRAASQASSIWFRGHRRAIWKLQSSAHRQVVDHFGSLSIPMPPRDKSVQLLREEEKSSYRQFMAAAWPLLRPEERSDWGVLFAMQHHRLPTRLVDWSESFLCALFFAHRGRKPDESAVVWALFPDLLNKVATGIEALVALDHSVGPKRLNTNDWHPQYVYPERELATIATAPVLTNPRMVAQRAAFTLMGDSFLPLEEQFDGQLLADEVLVKIELPAERFAEVDAFLEVTGVTPYSYFPDVEGLAAQHEERMHWMRRKVRDLYLGGGEGSGEGRK